MLIMSSLEQLSFFSSFFFLEWLTLKRIIYQIIFQLYRKKKEEKGGEKPFCGFNCFAVSGGDSAQLIKAHTADALSSWLSAASLEHWALLMDQIVPQLI